MLLPEPYTEQLLEHRAESHAWIAQQPGGQLGVEQLLGQQRELSEAGQILACGVNHPLRIGNRLLHCRKVGWLTEGNRVHEMGPGACPA